MVKNLKNIHPFLLSCEMFFILLNNKKDEEKNQL